MKEEKTVLINLAKAWWSGFSINEQKALKIKHFGENFPECSVYSKEGNNILFIWEKELNK